ncbi:MAG: hexosaminidase [Anaerophaga sp.]|nr:hexosaminidase [Anaerophaga sp.]
MNIMETSLKFLFVSALAVFAMSCGEQYPPTNLANNHIIPKPASVVATHGTFVLDKDAVIFYDAGNEDLKKNAEYLAGLLRPSTGFVVETKATSRDPRDGIYLTAGVDKDSLLGEGGYELVISEKKVKIASPYPNGVFYGIQTVRQLLPADIESHSDDTRKKWFLPTGTIRDWPEYLYRGVMLDVSRHFFGVETVKRFIDYLSLFKFNALHLHLSDDQGWRIEIESWPNLTRHGGSTEVGGGKGGYYTKDDYKAIVEYAAGHHITIIPEIDMPGHTNAALASYPELNCDGKARELYTGTKVGFSTLCTDKEIVYEFVDDVVREISELTPGPWFHIGGDESHSTEQDDYVRFINRVREIVNKYGKKVIGWDEIAHADINSEDVVQFWARENNALEGVKKGAGVIMSPSSHAYMDMKYDSTTVLGLSWAGLTEVDDAYNWDPVALVDGIEKIDILGVEAPLWTETIETLDDIEYMTFPRLPGYAEIGWTATENRFWEDYKVRLGKQKERFEAMDVNYYKSPLVPWQDEEDIFIEEQKEGEVK